MTPTKRFWIGGAGALIPLLLTLLALDVQPILEDSSKITWPLCAGALFRYLVLFIIGGVVAAMNSDEIKPVKLVQLGIGAPAVLTSLISANTPQAKVFQPQPVAQPAARPTGSLFPLGIVGTAYAMERVANGGQGHPNIRLAGNISEFWAGATRGLSGVAVGRDANNVTILNNTDANGWYVIAGSFKTRAAADQYATELNNKFKGKYAAEAFDPVNNNFYGVSIGRDLSLVDAAKMQASAKQDHLDAFIAKGD